MTAFIAILAATIPTIIYGTLVWWLDRYEKEPAWLIAAAFLWGSLPAIALAVLFELGLQIPLVRSPLAPDLAAWGLAPLVEEPIKALALVGLFLWARREFDGPLDGIVYGSLVGFGFSMTENLLYFLRYSDEISALFWLRGVFFGLNHALFSSMVGLALGAVRYRRSRPATQLVFSLGLALAILFHALHNYATRYQFTGLFFSWLVQSSGVLVVLAIAVLAWRNERRWIEQELGDEVRAGVISAADYAEIASPARRVRRQIRTLLTGGWARYRQTRRLHQLATELAFCKSQLRLDDRFRTCDERDQLRGELTALRALIERDEQVWGEL
ncbi:MAG TPA: PrsW family intramembrane metalloprotease [Roseiflexaceae bacterium]|nr:PrsW family intramembrane metalloprotease [Roseiflexaceae bacterium]